MKAQPHKDFGFFFWVHMVLVAGAYLSIVLFDWKVILFGALLLELQYRLNGGCVLTHLEFGRDGSNTFLGHYIRKVLPRISLEQIEFVNRVIAPVVVVAIAFILQTFFGFQPLLF